MAKKTKIVIAHRGNVDGPKPERENTPDYIQEALDEGFFVEVDVWGVGEELFLGHDEPVTPITPDYLKDDRFWCHAKNVDALRIMLGHGIHCFFHDTDDVTLTSKGFMWTMTGRKVVPGAFCVMPETSGLPDHDNYLGVCTDLARVYRARLT